MVKQVDKAVLDAFTDGADLETGVQVMSLANGGVGYALDAFNAPLVSDDMKARVNAASRAIAAGDLAVHDYVTDDTCPAMSF